MTISTIEDLLQQSGLDDQANLRALLSEIEALGASDAPAPSAEVLALMAPSTGITRPRLPSRRHTAMVVALAVAASLGMGATAAAAAIPEVRRAAQNVIQTVMHAVVPDLSTSTAPSEAPSRRDSPVPKTHSSDSDGQGRSVTKSSVSPPKSTSAPSSPPRATAVPAKPHVTDAPVVPPAQIDTEKHSPPVRPHAP